MTDEELTPTFILKHVDELDRQHDDGHRRLRTDLREVERRLDNAEARLGRTETALTTNDRDHETLRGTPVDVNKLRFTPALVVVIVTTVVSAIGGAWASAAKVDVVLARVEGLSALQDQRYSELKQAIEAQRIAADKREVEANRRLKEFQDQELKETLLKQGTKR